MKDLMFQTDTTIPRCQIPFLHIFGVPTNTFSFLKDAWHWHISRHMWHGQVLRSWFFHLEQYLTKKAGHSLPTLWDHCIFRGTTQHRHLTETSILDTCLVCSMYDKTSSVRTLWISGDDLLNAQLCQGNVRYSLQPLPFKYSTSPAPLGSPEDQQWLLAPGEGGRTHRTCQ